MISRDDLSFRRGVTHAALAFAHRAQRKERTGSPYAREYAGGTSARSLIAGKVGITVDNKFPFRGRVAYPRMHLHLEGAIDIANEPMQGLVATGSPFRDAGSQEATWPKHLESTHSRRVQDFP